jgi:hypothetical protein
MTRRAIFGLGFLLAAAGIAAGCNFMAGLHSDGRESNAHVLVADGKAALGRGDYTRAAEYFRLAGEHNPRDSEARVGYAEARMGAQGFSLGEFSKTFLDTVNSGASSTQGFELIVPSQWGVATVAEVEAILSELIAVLDPVVLGQCEGPYRSTDVNLNLNIGILYLLRVVASVEAFSSDFTIRNLAKTSSQVAGMGIPPAVLAQLPQEFLWFIDSANQQPTAPVRSSMAGDVDAALQRLQVAAANSVAQTLIQDVLTAFDPWQLLANQ